MKILDSFIADNAEERIMVKLLQFDTTFLFPPKHVYIIAQERMNPFRYVYFTMFFARRKYNQIKNAYKSAWLEYGVYEVGGCDAK